MLYEIDEITLIPARISTIRSRSECNPYNKDGMLPLFTAPMNAVIDDKNYKQFLNQKINTIIPWKVSLKTRKSLMTTTFVAMSIDEFAQFIEDHIQISLKVPHYICVDVANGHMQHLIELCADAKSMFGSNLVLMTGNIANPNTYINYAEAGIDFVRVSVGSGSCCTTANNLGCYYPMGSLIIDTVKVKNNILDTIAAANLRGISHNYKSIPLIVADGGFNNYDKIIKALALGADYVMIGELLAQTEEACGEEVIKEVKTDIVESVKIDNNNTQKVYTSKLVPKRLRVYYGMSTKKAQRERGRKKLKTSEGLEKLVPIKYNLSDFVQLFTDYLKSAMSYLNKTSIDDIKNVDYEYITYTSKVKLYKNDKL